MFTKQHFVYVLVTVFFLKLGYASTRPNVDEIESDEAKVSNQKNDPSELNIFQ